MSGISLLSYKKKKTKPNLKIDDFAGTSLKTEIMRQTTGKESERQATPENHSQDRLTWIRNHWAINQWEHLNINFDNLLEAGCKPVWEQETLRPTVLGLKEGARFP